MKVRLYTLTIASSSEYGCDIESVENFSDLDDAKQKMKEEFNHHCKRFENELEVEHIGKILCNTNFRVYNDDNTSIMASGEIIENTIEISL
jgi:hypothetical protein